MNFLENLGHIIDVKNAVDPFRCRTVNKHPVSQICVYVNHCFSDSLRMTRKTCLMVLGCYIRHMEAKLVSSGYSEESRVNFHYTSWFLTYVNEDCPPVNLILLYMLTEFRI
jgi:hypothetical protein